MTPAEQARRGIWTVPRLWPGATVACLATGPSLTREAVETCRGRVYTIAVNDAYRLAPWADVLYACDAAWWDVHDGVPAFRGLKVGGSKRLKWPDVKVLRAGPPQGVSDDPSVLAHGASSGYQAVNLAVHLGARRVLLVGYDGAARDGRDHFFGSHPSGLTAPDFSTMLEAWPSLCQPLERLGVEVVNCTPGSAIDCFPISELRAECIRGARQV